LRIGFLASANPRADMVRLEPFRAYLAEHLAVPVDLLPFRDYQALIAAEAGDRVNYAINSAVSYAAADAKCNCLDPLAVPTALDGARGYYALLLTRADSPIKSLADAKGARVALSAEDSIAGRLVPLRGFADAKIDPKAYFSEVVMKPGPEAAIAALLSGEVDLAVGWSSLRGDPTAGYSFGVLTRMVAEGRLAMDQVRVAWQSPLIPFGPHTIRRDAPEGFRPVLLDVLSGLAETAPEIMDAVDPTSFGGGGFVPARPEDYAMIVELVAAPPVGD
jgi:phosphonate transport system substrate-binding protein